MFLSCSRWEYEDLSIESLESFPETYLSLISVDTIFARTDSIGNAVYLFDENIKPPFSPTISIGPLGQSLEIIEQFGDARRTEITAASADISIEDLITEEDVVVVPLVQF